MLLFPPALVVDPILSENRRKRSTLAPIVSNAWLSGLALHYGNFLKPSSHTSHFAICKCEAQRLMGGAASPLPDSPPHGQRGRCPSREAKSCAKLLAGCIVFCDSDLCAKLLADGVAKFCAKLSKPISRIHRPTCLTRHTRHTHKQKAKREAQSLALPYAKREAPRKWGCALRVVERRPLFCNSVVKDQIGSFLCHFPSAQAHLQSERSL